jgi:hypothetical protein
LISFFGLIGFMEKLKRMISDVTRGHIRVRHILQGLGAFLALLGCSSGAVPESGILRLDYEGPPITGGGIEPPMLRFSEETPSIDPQDPRWFVWKGKHWYPVGYYPNIAAFTADQTDYEEFYRTLIDTLAANNINYLRNVFSMGQPFGEAMIVYQRTGPGKAADGMPKVDLTRFNQEYFDYWRKVIEYAGTKEMVVQLVLFDNWHNKKWVVSESRSGNIWGMKYDFYAGENNANGIDAGDLSDWHDIRHPVYEHQKALVRAAVDNLGDLPNLIWEISNENYTSQEWELSLANYLTQYEASRGYPPHLVMPRDLPNHDGAGGKKNPPKQAYQELTKNTRQRRPLIADNDGGGHADPDTRRQKAWAALTAGGHISYFHGGLHRLDELNSEDAALGMKYLGMVVKFLDEFSIDLRGMEPCGSSVSNGWCLWKPGEQAILYLMTGGSVTVRDLPLDYTAFWFDPRNGSSSPAGTGPEFTTPGPNDWVLYIQRAN